MKKRKINDLYRYIELEAINKYGRPYKEVYEARLYSKILKSLRKYPPQRWRISAILYVLDSDKRLMLAMSKG